MITNHRFWAKVEKTSTCWLWTGAKDRHGYGLWSPPRSSGRRMGMAHRFLYEDTNGPVPQGLELDHLCRVRSCVNPTHLEPVTHAENMRRASEACTECPRGHAYDETNTYRRSNGTKQCRACAREAARIKQGYYERRRAA